MIKTFNTQSGLAAKQKPSISIVLAAILTLACHHAMGVQATVTLGFAARFAVLARLSRGAGQGRRRAENRVGVRSSVETPRAAAGIRPAAVRLTLIGVDEFARRFRAFVRQRAGRVPCVAFQHDEARIANRRRPFLVTVHRAQPAAGRAKYQRRALL